MIRILLVDDQPVIRSGLQAVILSCDDLELVGEAEDGAMGVALCGALRPDLVLMDILMPRMDGITATKLICKRYPQIPVLALTSFLEEGLVQSALAAGASDCLLKNVSADELVAAIRATYRSSTRFTTTTRAEQQAQQATLFAAHRIMTTLPN